MPFAIFFLLSLLNYKNDVTVLFNYLLFTSIFCTANDQLIAKEDDD